MRIIFVVIVLSQFSKGIYIVQKNVANSPDGNMKIYMDDARDTPRGWERTYTVEQTIEALQTRKVTHLSLDNDLGEGHQEGYKVMDWLEETVFNDMHFPMPEVTIHSSNASRVEYMQRALRSIERIRQQQVGGS